MSDSSRSEPPHPDAPEQTGLPAISPDIVEQEQDQEHGPEFDNIVPTRAYHMVPIVGLGGSAGSIPALQRFFATMPGDSGMAFVVVLHLSTDRESIMDEILRRATPMRVVQPSDGEKVEANTVYVIPPGKFLSAGDGILQVTPLEPERGKRVAVDLFFRTLADSHGPLAIAIILSGADGDGALGIKRIKERGGLTVAQDPDEAEHAGMPRTAIDTGMVDWVLPANQMAPRLVEYRLNAGRLQLPAEEGPQPAKVPATASDVDENALRDVLSYLRSRSGRDFSCYKRGTVVRRISRRMQVNGIGTMPLYLDYLRTHPGEVGALQQDLLISVTNFFRDRDAFQAVESQISAIISNKGAGDAVRVWSAGCATGEEAYSLAMLLLEQSGRMESPPPIQVFATDLDTDAIAAARDGLYPFTIQADVSEERLRRFFVKEHRGYRARRELRECVLFAVHDLLKDAPFSRVDFFTCRNLLIYLTPEAQQRVFDIAHFALRPEAWLFIGTSESVDEDRGLWTTVNKKYRIYRRKSVARPNLPVPIGPAILARAIDAQDRAKNGPFLPSSAFVTKSWTTVEREAQERGGTRVSWEELHFRLIEGLSPPSVIVTQDYDIVHVSENAGRFLHFGPGQPSVNLLQVVHSMLRVELRAALFRAAQSMVAVEVFRVPVEIEKEALLVDIRVSPGNAIAPDYLLVVFSVREKADSMVVEARQEAEPAVRHLEREIEQLKLRLRDTVEQFEASTEEHKASNEELQAMNEELRSSGEELETSREELQSLNEELSTVNQELKSKVDDLSRANSDLANLMAATGVATIFLDRELAITRYTPSAVTLFRLIPSDVGRPLTDLTHQLNYPELKPDAAQVLETLIAVKREVSAGHRWFLAHLLPYRTDEDRIAGVVLTFVDVTDARQADVALRTSEQRLRTLADAVPQIIWSNDENGRANYFNRRWYEYTGLSAEGSTGGGWQVIVHPDDEMAAKARWREAQSEGRIFDTEYRLRRKDGSYRWFIGRNVPVFGPHRKLEGWFGTATDVDDLKEAHASLRASEEQFRRAIEEAPIPVVMYAEDGQILQVSRTWTELTGYSSSDMPTIDSWLVNADPGSGLELRNRMKELFRGGARLQHSEINVAALGGIRRWSFSASAPGFLRDGRRFVVVMALDITERTQAEADLRDSQEKLRLVVDNARDYAILSLDLERRIISWNRGAETILQYSQDEAVEQSADMIFIPEDRAAGVPAQEAGTAIAQGRSVDERWHVRKDGSRFWGSGVMMAMHNASGEPVGLVKIFRDHTEQLRAKESLEQSREELLVALAEADNARAEAVAAGMAKDHFLAVLSHELRTPLTPVMMATQLLRRRTDLPDPVREALDMIRRNVELESRFVDDLLDVTRIARGKLELVLRTMDVHEAIAQAVEISRPDLEAKSQHLKMALDAKAHQIEGDISRLQQVVWNLLKNAAKFSPEASDIRLSTRNDHGSLLIEVSDDGIGISPAALAQIFEPFTQADPSIARQFGGLGLGLAIARASVSAHGGELRVHSAGPGQGATFTVALPLAGTGEGEGDAPMNQASS